MYEGSDGFAVNYEEVSREGGSFRLKNVLCNSIAE